MSIQYKAGYKYQLVADYVISVSLPTTAETMFLSLTEGQLFIRAGYAWDGPSGPAIDTKNFMRGSLVHDAIYQLIRDGHVPEHYRWYADRMLQKICVQDGMSALRAWWVYKAIRFGGKSSAEITAGRQTLFAP